MTEIIWEVDKDVGCWRAYLNGNEYVGTVYTDGGAVFGDNHVLLYGCRKYSSAYSAAVSLKNYIDMGGRAKQDY